MSAAERTTLMVMLAEGLPPSTAAQHLGRSRSTISRELARNRSGAGDIHEPYDAIVADERAIVILQSAFRRKRHYEKNVKNLKYVLRSEPKSFHQPTQIYKKK